MHFLFFCWCFHLFISQVQRGTTQDIFFCDLFFFALALCREYAPMDFFVFYFILFLLSPWGGNGNK